MINNFIISFLVAGLLLTSNCSKTKKEESSNVVADTVKQDVQTGRLDTSKVATEQSDPSKTLGIVSHKFMNKGCPTVILVTEPEGDTLVLVPRDALMQDYDIDGLHISFNYRLLKRPSPPGCDKGIPAEIADISKK